MTPPVGGFAPYPVYHDPSDRDRCGNPGCERPALSDSSFENPLCLECELKYLNVMIADMQNDIDDIAVRLDQFKARRAKLIEQ